MFNCVEFDCTLDVALIICVVFYVGWEVEFTAYVIFWLTDVVLLDETYDELVVEFMAVTLVVFVWPVKPVFLGPIEVMLVEFEFTTFDGLVMFEAYSIDFFVY